MTIDASKVVAQELSDKIKTFRANEASFRKQSSEFQNHADQYTELAEEIKAKADALVSYMDANGLGFVETIEQFPRNL